jgi:hypothetical protein
MTIEGALSVAGLVLVFALLWRSNRVTDRRLSEIQWELNALRDSMSRILLTQMSEKPHNEPPLPDGIPRSPGIPLTGRLVALRRHLQPFQLKQPMHLKSMMRSSLR